MQKKAFTLINKGMNRDLSISKAGESSAYTNKNIRIIARDHDTLLSVTNERGTQEISLATSITGDLVGWGVLNNYVILFTHASSGDKPDNIYRVEYNQSTGAYTNTLLYNGALNFSLSHPIEAITYYEAEDIQKVYWLDGENPLRMLNFMASETEKAYWVKTNTTFNFHDDYFDVNRGVAYNLSVAITKDNSGNPRPNGVIQYLITYYNNHAQESDYAWVSDLIYLSPNKIGGAPDENNSNKITLKISNIDTRFTHLRLYSIFKSSYEGVSIGNIVADIETSAATNGAIVLVDDAAHQTAIDVTELLYLGSRDAKISTMTYKDQTLFLGNIQLQQSNDNAIRTAIQNNMFVLGGGAFTDGVTWEAKTSSSGSVGIEFMHSSGLVPEIQDIPLEDSDEVYSYTNQLSLTSSNITSFKGGEKYRFGLKFRKPSGEESDVFWIGDKVNHLYPVVDSANGVIKRVVVKCVIASAVISAAKTTCGYSSVRLMIAEASYADRAVKAQGIINPTVFNVWNRYKGRIYAAPSWTSRPRNAEFASGHFEAIHNTGDSTAEIECNYWETENPPVPYYQLEDYGTDNEHYIDEESGQTSYNYGMLIYKMTKTLTTATVQACGILAKTTTGSVSPLSDVSFASADIPSGRGEKAKTGVSNATILVKTTTTMVSVGAKDTMMKSLLSRISDAIKSDLPELYGYVVSLEALSAWYDATDNGGAGYWSVVFSRPTEDKKDSFYGAANYNPSTNTTERWVQLSEGAGSNSLNYSPAYNKKHLMFVDENIVTLDSPEITYESTLMDNVENYKLRIVGVAPVSGRISDIYVDATRGDFVGENLANDKFSGSASAEDNAGLLAWPLWREHGLVKKEEAENNVKKRTSYDYIKGANVVNYWLYLWSKSDIIDGFTDEDVTVFDGDAYSRIRQKTIGNLRFSKETIYNQDWSEMWEADDVQVRLFNYTHSQYMSLDVADDSVYYDGFIDDVLMVPANFKYPILYSTGEYDKDSLSDGSTNKYLFTNSPVTITYASNPHVVLRLPSTLDVANSKYIQKVLPYFDGETAPTFPTRDSDVSGAMIPWIPQDENIVYITWLGSYPSTSPEAMSFSVLPNGTISVYAYFLENGSSDFVHKFWEPAKSSYPGMPLYVWLGNNDGKYLIDITTGTESISQSYSDTGYINYTLSGVQIKEHFAWDDPSSTEEVFVDVAQFSTDGIPTEKGTRVLDMRWGTYSDVSLADYPYTDYDIDAGDELDYDFGGASFDSTKPYFFIGEVFYDYDDPLNEDTRYGGITNSAVRNCKFIPAGPTYILGSSALTVYGNEGDTYFQRWDDLRIKPIPGTNTNNVVDIVSAMVETHINLDGRYDKQRGVRYIASIEPENFGLINRVYTQPDDFFASRSLNLDYDYNSFGSAISWTLEKHDAAETDEWMHITLASSLKLDGDKGPCNALRRYQNRIIAFQDRCLSEILFNSRVQVNASDGIPIEITNSGKVDGKQVITSNSGCTNKWSIVEGKQALYYVDNINKAFCAFNGQVANLSEKLGFTAWFKEHNKMASWTPAASFPNFVSYYDRIHSDVYLVGGWDTNEPCLVYNEMLGVFTSFFDYANVPMMVNVDDEFVSFYKGAAVNGKLYRQNRGKYNNFFGTYKPFSAMYRVTPDPFGDKIWSNIEYRADFYDVNPTGSGSGSGEILEEGLIDGGVGTYKKDTTFDALKVWNEYQTTGNFTGTASLFNDGRLQKMFRIWRCQIPRASGSQYNLDRIRNPWVNIEFKKSVPGSGQDQYGEELMQLHDATIIYYE